MRHDTRNPLAQTYVVLARGAVRWDGEMTAREASMRYDYPSALNPRLWMGKTEPSSGSKRKGKERKGKERKEKERRKLMLVMSRLSRVER